MGGSEPTPQAPWWAMYAFGLVVEAIFIMALVMSFLGEDKTLLNVMCTAAVAQAGIVGNYIYGSSASGRKKDELIAQITQTNGNPPGDAHGPVPGANGGPGKRGS